MTGPGPSSRRLAGMGMHFTSLPSPYGIGDIGDAARDFLVELSSMGLAVWQVLPSGPTAYGDSPYQPLSAFAGNEMLIGLEPAVRGGMLAHDETEVLTRLPIERVDYGELIPLKRDLLDQAAARFHDMADSRTLADYRAFLDRSAAAWLDDYALFRILKTLHEERPWPDWDTPYVHRDEAALEAVRAAHADTIERVRIAQYFFDRQWRVLRQRARRAGVQLMGDIPIYIALDSADAWACPELLRVDAGGRPSHVAGVPPDYFSEDGQLWGNPLYDWPHHRRSGYAWWIERMRHAATMFDLLRVDHFRGFVGYWSVPGGEDTARNGQWEPGPGAALFEALHGALGRLPIVAEDLGVITPEVDALRHRYDIPGMKVLQFELADPDFDPAAIPVDCVCYTGTHDNDTTQGWFQGTGADTRSAGERRATRENALRLTGGGAETIHDDLWRLALGSKACLAVAPMQDLLGLGSEARMNVPGTTADNWRWRLKPGQLEKQRRLEIRATVKAASRQPPDPLH